MQSVPITTNEYESRSGEVYSIQHYVIKFVSDLRQFCGFLMVLRFPPPINIKNYQNIVESGIKYHNPLYTNEICLY